jgi:two-component system phosphate regulon sensor histidine kinase PhoR
LDSDYRSIWIRAALTLVVTLVICTIVGLMLSPASGWAAAVLVMLLALWWHLRNIAVLIKWLRDPQRPVPGSDGVWEDVFSGLHRLMRAGNLEREQLTAELARFRSAGTAMPDGVVILDSGNHIEWCNPIAGRFFGIDSDRDAGQQILNLVRAPSLTSYLREGEFSQPLILRVSRTEDLVLSLRVIPYGQDQRLLLSRDVTQAERLEAMRRDFVANVSHELRTPLTVVNGFVETLADGRISLPEARIREVLALMQQQTGRMLRLIEDLLTLSALESSPGLASETAIDVGGMLAALHAEGVALSSGRHRVQLQTGQPVSLLGDEKDLRSAFGNLVSNAIRYTPAGGEVRLSWRVRESGEGEFAVSDSGIGIESHHIPRLTERFYRVDQSRSRDTGGTGLGLAIVKHVLNRHQAMLEVQSEPGKGSRFMAVFPAQRVRPVVPAQASAS